MLNTKILHMHDRCSLPNRLAQYKDLFMRRLEFPVTLQTAYDLSVPWEYLYSFEVRRSGNPWYDILQRSGIVRCDLSVNTRFNIIKIEDMRTLFGFRGTGLQRALQSVLFSAVNDVFGIDRVVFLNARKGASEYVHNSGLFYDIESRSKLYGEDLTCRIKLAKARTLLMLETDAVLY